MTLYYLIRKTCKLFFIVAFVFFTYNCAKVGSISGGPKDETPPVFVGSKPEMGALNFTGKKIRIEFDEYIQLKDAQQQFNISPPLNKKPKLWIYNKAVIVEYTDTLKDSTTYTLSFGNSIVDNNEGNIVENFEFVFSTTNYLDSMGVEGVIMDAFTAKPDKDPFLLALYSNLSDSAPLTQVPMFTGRSNKRGAFSINNVKPGIYKLYAFKDGNSNFKYDALSEAFAFSDSLIVLDPHAMAQKAHQCTHDSIFKHKPHENPEMADSLVCKHSPNKLTVSLWSFTERDKKQFLKEYARKERRKASLVFNNRVIGDSISIKPLYHDTVDWFLPEWGPAGDSLQIWFTDTAVMRSDSLKMVIGYHAVSQALDTTWKADTLSFRFVDEPAPKRKKEDTTVIVEKMIVNTLLSGVQDLHVPLRLETQYPVSSFNPELIELYQKVDTIEHRKAITVVRDSLYPRLFNIVHRWESQMPYRLLVLPGCFENIYNLPHDTINQRFNTQKEEYYGRYVVNISGSNGSALIVQLLVKDKVAYEQYCMGDGAVTFGFLRPASYTLKVIFDTDRNRRYTTGDYYLKQQAEKALFYDEEINVRSNWDTTIDWNLELEQQIAIDELQITNNE